MAVAGGQVPDSGDEEMVGRIAQLVREHVPEEATLLVASGGLEDLLRVAPGAREFPDPAAPSAYDASGLAAIAQLEAQRARGSDFLLIPASERWRVDEDGAFERHLTQWYRPLVDDEHATLFALRAPPGAESSVWNDLRRTIARCQRELDRDPVILDWRTGLNLRGQFPELQIFSPLNGGSSLPYLDETIDVVAMSASAAPAEAAEAHRVARLAIISLPSTPTSGSLEVEWEGDMEASFEKAAIIVPCLVPSEDARASLASLRDTLDGIDAEVVLACGPASLGSGSAPREWADLDDRVRLIEVAEEVSFAAACNSAAAAASSETLVFLSPVGCPLGEWFSPLVRIFRQHRGAGAVGAKVLTDHGELLNAGGELLPDGSPRSNGLGANPDDPQYSCVRAVDFISPALLATPREVFEAVGGLAAKSALPSMDYCLKLGRRGYSVYYQPASSVVLLDNSSALGFSAGARDGSELPAPKPGDGG